MPTPTEDGLVVRVLENPYPHIVGEEEFTAMMLSIGHNLKTLIDAGYSAGQFKRNSLGLCLMNPTKPARRGSEAVMALFTIGPEGRLYLPNAVAKAVTHYNFGEDCGKLAYVEPYRLVDGSFVYGHSAEVAGTIAGASALSEAQDRYVATLVAAEFNLNATEAHTFWKLRNPDSKWFCNQDGPLDEFSTIAAKIDGPSVIDEDAGYDGGADAG